MQKIIQTILLVGGALAACAAQTVQPPPCSWVSVLRDSSGKPVAGATLELSLTSALPQLTPVLPLEATTDPSGVFAFPDLPPGTYALVVQRNGRESRLGRSLQFRAGDHLKAWVSLTADERQIELHPYVGTTFTAIRETA
jgi:hypothetical protein